MKPRRFWLLVVALALIACGLVWKWESARGQGSPADKTASGRAAPLADSLPLSTTSRRGAVSADASAKNPDTPQESVTLSDEDRAKEIDRGNMRSLHKGLVRYREIHGHFPEYLSQLVPDFVDANALFSPRSPQDGMNSILTSDHPDPNLGQVSYGYEFSNLEFRDGRTFAEIKEVQRAEWGDVVPILRAFGYGKVINMSYGGDLYETALNWEWDPATLDVVAARGWGPGLTEGKFAEVRVLGAGGQPLANAQVWADGRHYSFSLPDRPYTTDANGFVKIPLGTDLERTNLVLRAEGSGLMSPAVAFPSGQPPGSYDLTAQTAQVVGGQVIDAAGKPVADTWVYLKAPAGTQDGEESSPAGVSLGAVKTDANGRWTTRLHPQDAAAFNLVTTGGPDIPKFSPGQPVNAAAALGRAAVSVVPAPKDHSSDAKVGGN